MKEVLHLEIRKQIYSILEKNPGINLSTMSEHLNISVQLADYHLSYLEKHGIITIDKKGGYKRYYIKGKIGIEDKKMLSLLHMDIPLSIVVFLLNHPSSKPKMIREELKISPALLTYYLKKLAKHQIIGQRLPTEKNHFSVLEPDKIIGLLIQYKKNVLLERFSDTWLADIPLSAKPTTDKPSEENTE